MLAAIYKVTSCSSNIAGLRASNTSHHMGYPRTFFYVYKKITFKNNLEMKKTELSNLKLIRSYLCSCMSKIWWNRLVMWSTEKKILINSSFIGFIKDFAGKNMKKKKIKSWIIIWLSRKFRTHLLNLNNIFWMSDSSKL